MLLIGFHLLGLFDISRIFFPLGLGLLLEYVLLSGPDLPYAFESICQSCTYYDSTGLPDWHFVLAKVRKKYYLSEFPNCKEFHDRVLEAEWHLKDVIPKGGVARQFLLAPRKYQKILMFNRNRLTRELLFLGCVPEKIDAFYNELEQILVEAMKLLTLIWLLEALLHFLTLVIAVCIFEFPDNLRPPNTTMPWIIKPALFVLWGVCWMFIYNNSISPFKEYSPNDARGTGTFFVFLRSIFY